VKPLESHEADLVDRLAAALAPGAAELLASFSDALGKRVDERGRKRNDPGRHLIGATLVFLAKGHSRTTGSRAIRGGFHGRILNTMGHASPALIGIPALFQVPLWKRTCRDPLGRIAPMYR